MVRTWLFARTNLVRVGAGVLYARSTCRILTPSIFALSLVYAGLAILNPSAKAQVRQYSLSVAALFKLMIQEKEAEFVARIRAVRFLSSHDSCVLFALNISGTMGLPIEKSFDFANLLCLIDMKKKCKNNRPENLCLGTVMRVSNRSCCQTTCWISTRSEVCPRTSANPTRIWRCWRWSTVGTSSR